MRPFLAAALLAAASPAGSEVLLVKLGKPAPEPVRSWYLALDALLSEVDALGERVAVAGATPQAADAADAALRLSAIAEHAGLVVGASGAKELAAKLSSAGQGSGPLSSADADLLSDPESRSAIRLAGLLRERALESTGPKSVANALLSEEGAAWELPFLAVDGLSGARATPILSALAAATRVAAPAQAAASLRRAWIRSPGVETILDLAAPPGSPSVRFRADASGAGPRDQAALYFLARALFECGFAVSADAGVVRAAFGAERGAGPEERAERFVSAWSAAAASRRLPPYLKNYLSETLTRRQSEELLEGLARAFAAEGHLPLAGEGQDSLSRGMAAWMEKSGGRQSLRAQMDSTLASLSLAPFPPGVAVGQRTIDLHYNEPVAAALARGEVRHARDRLLRDPHWDPLERLHSAFAIPAAWRGRLGPALAWSAPAGASGGARVERGQWRVGPDAWLIVLTHRGPDGRPARLAAEVASSDGRRRAVSAEAVFSRLDELGLLSAIEGGTSAPPAESAWAGAPLAAGGPVEGPITFDAARAAEGGKIFVTPYLAAADRVLARKAKAIVSTSGGPAVAVVAARAGIPAVDLVRGSWADGAGLALEQPVWGPVRGAGRAVMELRRILLREGDRVRVDGRRGTVELLP